MRTTTLPAGMSLMIDTDENAGTGWESFDYIVNRVAEKDVSIWLEKNNGGWKWTKVAKVNVRANENELHFAIPRTAIGLPADRIAIDFKWADNLQRPGDIMDFYLSGDVAPEGRFTYRYVAQ